MKGLGRAASGQASSVRPLTHRQSKRRPLDSSRPSTWIGASPQSRSNSVSAHSRPRQAKASSKENPFEIRSSFENSPSAAGHLASVWNSSESSARSPGKPAASSRAEKWRAQSDGLLSFEENSFT